MKKLRKKVRLENTVEGYASCTCYCGCSCNCSCIVIMFNRTSNLDDANSGGKNHTFQSTGNTNMR